MVNEFLLAFTFLTVLPVGRLIKSYDSPPGRIFSYFPLVGLTIGIILWVVASISFLPRDLTAFLTLGVWVYLTGGLHLDGLADSCDGLFATVSLERRLEIMKDPRTGSFAVIGIALLLLGKWVALRTLSPAFLLIPAVVGRWAMVLAIAAFPNARTTGLAAQFRTGFGRTQLMVATLTTVVVVAVCGIMIDWRLLLVAAVAPVTVFIVGRWAAQRLGGGLTGDVYGALCEVVELICLICLNIT